MSIISSLYSGASGLTSHGEAISVVGDNIANANTVGYKRSRANFEDVLARSLNGADGPGTGTRLGQVQKVLTQGALLSTGLTTDLAITGDGFFQVRGNSGGLEGVFYTRAGQFKLDADGYLVTQDGLNLQGFQAGSDGTLMRRISDLQIPTYEMPPRATAAAAVAGNLDAAATTPAAAWDPTNAAATSNYSSTVTTYDSRGQAQPITMYFRREAGAGAWSWHAVVDGAALNAGTPGVPTEIGTGALTFDTSGRLMTEAGSISATFRDASPQTINVDLGDSVTTDAGSGLRGMTSYASSSTVSFISQDGYASGALTGMSVGTDGVIDGNFSNGTHRALGQVLLADFQNAQDMKRIGGQLWMETPESGAAVIGEATTGGRGAINGGSLEQSNVDMAQEFIDMIAFQRGFQASSRTISTADEMLQEVVNLKR
jgi:flagellar hook protein FlgE